MKISDHIYFYGQEKGLPLWGGTTSNTTVIRGRSKLTIIDPGPAVGPHLPRIKKEMREDGLRFQDIVNIVVTHSHADHAAAIPEIAKALDVRVFAHPIEKETVENPSKFWSDELGIGNNIFEETIPIPEFLIKNIFQMALGSHKEYNNVISLNDGDTPDIGIPARVVALPGHVRGEIGIHIPADNALIIGDLVHKGRYDLPSLNMPSSDVDQAIDSLKIIKSLEPDIIIAGHDGVVVGKEKIVSWMDTAIRRCEKLKEITLNEYQKNRNITLIELCRKLKTHKMNIPLYEQFIMAFVLLKNVK